MRRILALLASVIYLFSIIYHYVDMHRQSNNEQIAHYVHNIQSDIPDVQRDYVDADINECIDEQIGKADEIDTWWTDHDLDLLAAVIYYEAGSDECSDRHQQLVAQVVINRMNSSEFPDTIYDVITQQNPTQYSTYEMVLRDAGDINIIPKRCYDNALVSLNGDVECPDNIVWQANFKQGSGVYEEIHTSYSTSYFCYR